MMLFLKYIRPPPVCNLGVVGNQHSTFKIQLPKLTSGALPW